MTIAFDCDLKRPGCPLLQAALDGQTALAHRFDSKRWLVIPTPGLKLYEINEAQLQCLIQMTEESD